MRSFWFAEPCGGEESERVDDVEAETTAAVAEVGLGYAVVWLSGG